MAGVIVNIEALAELQLMALGHWSNATLHTYSNDYTPTGREVDTVPFTESAYSGYANATISSWGTAFLSGAGVPTLAAGSKEFAFTTGNLTETVYGQFLTTANGTLIAAERYALPIQMTGPGSGFTAQITIEGKLDTETVTVQ